VHKHSHTMIRHSDTKPQLRLLRAGGRPSRQIRSLIRQPAHPGAADLAHAVAGLHEILDIRRVLEGECAALAAARRRDFDLAVLTSAVDEMEVGLEREDHYVAGGLRFHLAIADATGNHVIAQLMHTMRDQLERGLGAAYRIPHSAPRSVEQYRGIVEAIRLRRPDEARARMREHVARIEQELRLLQEVS
jgi:DNA-binding FadR family transcriptional regulator